MNSDFKFVETSDRLEITFRGEAIAVFTASTQTKHDSRTLQQRAVEYLNTYGYMAEYRRRWLLKEFEPGTTFVSWSEDMMVDV